MKKLFFLAMMFLTLGFAQTAQAQAPPVGGPGQSFAWDHDGVGLDHFEVNIDFVPTWTNVQKSSVYPIPALSPGLHTFYVRACGTPGLGQICSASANMQFTVIAVTPKLPTNIRITGTVNITVTGTAVPGARNVPTRLPADKRPKE